MQQVLNVTLKKQIKLAVIEEAGRDCFVFNLDYVFRHVKTTVILAEH